MLVWAGVENAARVLVWAGVVNGACYTLAFTGSVCILSNERTRMDTLASHTSLYTHMQAQTGNLLLHVHTEMEALLYGGEYVDIDASIYRPDAANRMSHFALENINLVDSDEDGEGADVAVENEADGVCSNVCLYVCVLCSLLPSFCGDSKTEKVDQYVYHVYAIRSTLIPPSPF